MVIIGIYAFPRGIHGEGFHLTTTLLLPFAAWAAIRFGVKGAAATVVIIAATAVGFMVHGLHPYTSLDPQLAVWLMQEYLAVVAIMSIGLAILLHEIHQHNEQLEQRVDKRTVALRRSNLALEQANRRLNELASTDYLTGIASQRKSTGFSLKNRCYVTTTLHRYTGDVFYRWGSCLFLGGHLGCSVLSLLDPLHVWRHIIIKKSDLNSLYLLAWSGLYWPLYRRPSNDQNQPVCHHIPCIDHAYSVGLQRKQRWRGCCASNRRARQRDPGCLT